LPEGTAVGPPGGVNPLRVSAWSLPRATRRNHFQWTAGRPIALCVSRIISQRYWFRMSCATCSQSCANLPHFRNVRRRPKPLVISQASIRSGFSRYFVLSHSANRCINHSIRLLARETAFSKRIVTGVSSLGMTISRPSCPFFPVVVIQRADHSSYSAVLAAANQFVQMPPSAPEQLLVKSCQAR